MKGTRYGHAGVYLGNGKVFECTTGWGTRRCIISEIDKYGNRIYNGVKNVPWTWHGKLIYIDYSDQEGGGGDEEMTTYQNGSTAEPVYADTALKNKIGSLDPREKCDCYGEFKGRAVVRYKVNGTSDYKIGFCKWTGGIQ